MTSDRAGRLAPALLLLVVCSATFLTGLGSTSLFEPDEPRFAAATRQMLATGDYLTPWFNGRPRFEKPVLFYWMQAPAFAVLGPTEAAARLPSAVCGTLAVLLLFVIARRFFRAGAATIAALALATSFRFVIYGRQGLTDVPVLLFEMVALWGWLRARDDEARSKSFAWTAWAFVGLAAATKGPVAIIPLLVWIAFVLLDGDPRTAWRRMHPTGGVAIAVAIAAPWYIYMVAVHGRAYIDHALGYELVRRYADAEFPGPKRGLLYYFGVWPGDAAPWTMFFLAAVIWVARRWRWLEPGERRGVLFAGVWFVVVLLLFSSASGKLPHYLLPLYPPLAMLVGLFADIAASDRPIAPRLSWRIAVIATALTLLAASALVWVFLRRAFAVPPTGPAMLLPVCLALGALAALALESRGRRRGVVGALVVAFAIGYALLGVHVAPRYLQQMQPVRALGEVVASLATPGDRVSLYGSFGGPGLIFYSRHVVEFLSSHDEVVAFLAGDGRRFCVLSAADLEAVRQRSVPPLYVLARRDVLNIRFKRVLEGRAADPNRALLLVSNQPESGTR
jgi:4-amino-4-deoxy-L-arabinose transferase-like glycosyltransferase